MDEKKKYHSSVFLDGERRARKSDSAGFVVLKETAEGYLLLDLVTGDKYLFPNEEEEEEEEESLTSTMMANKMRVKN